MNQSKSSKPALFRHLIGSMALGLPRAGHGAPPSSADSHLSDRLELRSSPASPLVKFTRLAAYAVCLLGLAASVRAGTFTNNFDNGLPATGIVATGSADPANADADYDFTTGGFGGSGGVLKLTADKGSQQSGAIVDDLDSGKEVGGFEMWFKLLLHSDASAARPADGISINFAHADDSVVPSGSVGEEGTGTGLVIAFDTDDNGSEAPAIDIKLDGTTLFTQKMDGPVDAASSAQWVNTPTLKDSPANRLA